MKLKNDPHRIIPKLHAWVDELIPHIFVSTFGESALPHLTTNVEFRRYLDDECEYAWWDVIVKYAPPTTRYNMCHGLTIDEIVDVGEAMAEFAHGNYFRRIGHDVYSLGDGDDALAVTFGNDGAFHIWLRANNDWADALDE